MTGAATDPAARRLLRERIRAGRARRPATLVVLDDDPTGSQAVHGVPVITAWEPDDVRWAFENAGVGGFFVLTNTRALPPDAASARIAAIAAVVEQVAAERGGDYELLLRGDSTLRGHYPLESDLLAARASAAGAPYDALLLVPAYPEAGRVTVDDVHYVRLDRALVPVGDTDYARDASFGFGSSDLRDYVAEKTRGAVPAAAVRSIRAADLGAGPERVCELLRGCCGGVPVVVNAERPADLEVVALGLQQARAAGARVLVRSGPSFVAAELGLEPGEPLADPTAVAGAPRRGHGLIAVGSHVELTTRQVAAVRRRFPELAVIELDVHRAVADAQAEAARVCRLLVEALQDRDALVMTTRERVTAATAADSLALAARVSAALVQAVTGTVRAAQVGWVIAKGGITSSDLAVHALGIRRAEILGQLFPGAVSVWSDRGAAAGSAGMPYVVFAGNVGGDETLADAVAVLHGVGEGARVRSSG